MVMHTVRVVTTTKPLSAPADRKKTAARQNRLRFFLLLDEQIPDQRIKLPLSLDYFFAVVPDVFLTVD